jgi:hypothetical protein
MQFPAELLEPEERILWSAQPRQGVRFQPRDWYVVPASLLMFVICILFTAISGFSLYAAFANGDQMEIPFLFMFPLIGLALCVAGYQVAIGRFFRDAAERSRTLYALTDKRAFLVVTGPGGYNGYLPVNRETAFVIVPGFDGYASVRIASDAALYSSEWIARDPPAYFEFNEIKDATQAAAILNRIKDNRV